MAIAAILNVDGAPVDPGLLHTMLDVAPFARERDIWTEGPIGLASAPLRSPSVPLDALLRVRDDIALVFDGRLDDRTALCDQLGHRGATDTGAIADIDLLASAYARWGAECPRHILGDFAFAIWDQRRRSIVAARDRFGVKPFYIVRAGGSLVLSNVLRGIRRHPLVSDRLDDQTVGDLLLFGLGMDPERTPFADVARLPPAHVLECSGGGEFPHIQRYWSLNPGAVRFTRDPREAIDDFESALRIAVSDRLGAGRTGIFMSGGLDSSSIAAVAADVCGPSAPSVLRAFTGIYTTVAEDRERDYASLVSDTLNIGIEYLPLDRYALFERWDRGGLPPEPTTEPMTAVTADLLARAAAHGTSVLTGDGGDPLLLPSTFVSQIGRVPIRGLLAGLWQSLRAHDRPPLGIRSSVGRWVHGVRSGVPPWLGDSLLRVIDARGRWLDVHAARHADRGARSAAINNLTDPWWPSTFETYDPGAIGAPAALSYPFFDPRLVNVALRLPSFPYCSNKRVLREAMDGKLPEAVRVRPKTPLAVLPESFHGNWALADAVRALEAVPEMNRYVNIRAFESTVSPGDVFTNRAPGTLAAVSIAMWLRYSSSAVAHV